MLYLLNLSEISFRINIPNMVQMSSCFAQVCLENEITLATADSKFSTRRGWGRLCRGFTQEGSCTAVCFALVTLFFYFASRYLCTRWMDLCHSCTIRLELAANFSFHLKICQMCLLKFTRGQKLHNFEMFSHPKPNWTIAA